MPEVIDFNDLKAHMTEERGPVNQPPSQETVSNERKEVKKNTILAILFVLMLTGGYFFITYGGSASKEGIASYRQNVDAIFTSMQNDFPNLTKINCTEKDSTRDDCVEYILTFYPNMNSNAVGTQLDTVGKALGVSQSDMAHLKEFFKDILNQKKKFMKGRRAPLTFTISSTNVSRQEGESTVTVVCQESGGVIECISGR